VVPVRLRGKKLTVKTSAQVGGMFLHIIPHPVRDDRPAVLGDEYDMVCQQKDGMGFFPVFHARPPLTYKWIKIF
jgi:hypothetical protein